MTYSSLTKEELERLYQYVQQYESASTEKRKEMIESLANQIKQYGTEKTIR